ASSMKTWAARRKGLTSFITAGRSSIRKLRSSELSARRSTLPRTVSIFAALDVVLRARSENPRRIFLEHRWIDVSLIRTDRRSELRFFLEIRWSGAFWRAVFDNE